MADFDFDLFEEVNSQTLPPDFVPLGVQEAQDQQDELRQTGSDRARLFVKLCQQMHRFKREGNHRLMGSESFDQWVDDPENLQTRSSAQLAEQTWDVVVVRAMVPGYMLHGVMRDAAPDGGSLYVPVEGSDESGKKAIGQAKFMVIVPRIEEAWEKMVEGLAINGLTPDLRYLDGPKQWEPLLSHYLDPETEEQPVYLSIDEDPRWGDPSRQRPTGRLHKARYDTLMARRPDAYRAWIDEVWEALADATEMSVSQLKEKSQSGTGWKTAYSGSMTVGELLNFRRVVDLVSLLVGNLVGRPDREVVIDIKYREF